MKCFNCRKEIEGKAVYSDLYPKSPQCKKCFKEEQECIAFSEGVKLLAKAMAKSVK